MIQSKSDLLKYMEMDKFALDKTKKRLNLIVEPIWFFEVALRKHEYYHNVNSRNPLRAIFKVYWHFLHRWIGILLGFEIPINTIAGGLRINHIGNIVINKRVEIGEWLDISQCTTIGQGEFGNQNSVPKIGSNVRISPNCCIVGDIVIGNEVMIGANSFVNQSFTEIGSVVAGSPARLIGKKKYPYKRSLQGMEEDVH